jgi:hypothetical protein
MSLSKISPTVYLDLPSAHTQPALDAPSAILLFAWMGAPVRHMSKFIDYYNKLFPNSPILLVLSTPDGFFARSSVRSALIEPVYTAFKSLHIDPSNVLVHIFSNGGLNAFYTFVSLIPSKSFSPRLLVLDSAPGKTTLRGGVKAFTVDIKGRVKRFTMAILIALILCFISLVDKISGKGHLMDRLRAWLVDGKAIDKSTKRLFLYSDADELVHSDTVRETIKELEDRKYPVWSRNFGETRHVGHMRANPEEYWGEIVKIWNE